VEPWDVLRSLRGMVLTPPPEAPVGSPINRLLRPGTGALFLALLFWVGAVVAAPARDAAD